jgi:hypothetical protein
MRRISRSIILLFGLISLFGLGVFAQTEKPFLGLKLRPEVRAIADEIEQKTKRKIYSEFVGFESEFILGTSFISDEGTAIVRAAPRLKRDPEKLQAVIAHELLHLRLRTDNYPVFLFAPTVKTAKGLAQDVEQDNVNDLTSLIEHRIFKDEMDKFGLNRIIDLAGDAERSAIARGADEDGQSDALNFARAVLEYQNPADIERLRKVYLKNRWQRALKTGQEIAALISGSGVNSPENSARVFRLCLAKLYPTPRPAKLTPDKSVSAYRQMLISY